MKTIIKSTHKGNTFDYEEVLKKCMAYFKGDDLAATTWMNKYAMKTEDGKFLELTPEDMHRRMATEFARIEKKYKVAEKSRSLLSNYGKTRKPLTEKKIFEYFDHFKYIIPQGSVMAVLGNYNVLASLSNCVVLPEIFDSYGGIFYTDQQLAQMFKRRCGVGIDISTLRPEGTRVSNAAGTTSGPVSFMDRFSDTTREVAQKGRRGALMITMDVAHPDIEKFVIAKQDLTKITGANISVRLSDEFMQAVADDKEYLLRWPIDAANPKVTKKIKARELWNSIIQSAHHSAEPGLIFWDRQHQYSTSSIYPGFKNVSTNPCSEIAMQGGDSCRLIALNLFNFVKEPFTKNASFDYEKFAETTYEAQRLMDDLVDLELEAIERILQKVSKDKEPGNIKQVEIETWKLLYENGKKGRRTGLGFTALGDAIAALGLKFDSDKALKEIEKIMRTKLEAEFNSSIDMAIERGSFEAFTPETDNTSEFVQMMKSEFPGIYKRMMKHGRRNISISTVAPTGSLSILAQTSSGLEPVFMLSYKRRRKINPSDKSARVDFTDATGDAWQEFDVYHPKLKMWMNLNPGKDIAKSPYTGSTANEIDWIKRVKVQSLVQKYITHSISSTINLPSDVSKERVGEIYLEAWKQGLKGITIYRDSSRSGVLISNDEPVKTERYDEIKETTAPKRPKKLEADVIRFMNASEKWIAIVGLLKGRPYEIFTGKSDESFVIPASVNNGWVIKTKTIKDKSVYDFQYLDKDNNVVTVQGLSRTFERQYWNYAKLISGVLRHGMPLPLAVDLVSNLTLDNQSINNWKNGVARALKRYISDGTSAPDTLCPNCGDPEGLVYQEGCLTCKSCGYSKCD